MKLRATTDADLQRVITWIEDAGANRLWAGPKVRFPLSLDNLKEDIRFAETATLSMVDDLGELHGLGQLLERPVQRIHFARIIVSPAQRGKGIGRRLCQLLIAEGQKRFGKREFSLFVDSKNLPAIQLYRGLGFAPTEPPAGLFRPEGSIYMVLQSG
jgi:ribosomal protein S18 acetylase RimI-like enzyme